MAPNAMKTCKGLGTRKRRLCHCKRCRGQHFRLFHVCDKHEIQYGLHIGALSSSNLQEDISSSSTNSSQV